MTDEKPIWASKTLWVNTIAFVAALASSFGFEIGAEQQGALVGGVMAVVNIVLRLITDRPVKLKKPKNLSCLIVCFLFLSGCGGVLSTTDAALGVAEGNLPKIKRQLERRSDIKGEAYTSIPCATETGFFFRAPDNVKLSLYCLCDPEASAEICRWESFENVW